MHLSEVAPLSTLVYVRQQIPFISTWLPLYSLPWLLSPVMLGPSWLGEEQGMGFA